MSKLKILFIASEMTPIAKVGGLGDVIGALPKALHAKGADVRVLLPRYQRIELKGMKVAAKNVPVKFGSVDEKVTVYETIVDGIPVYAIDHDKYLSRGPIYFEKSAFVGTFTEMSRFLFFSRAAVAVLQKLRFRPDILHCHDWHTSMIIPLLSQEKTAHKPKTVLTIHNIANQGVWSAKEIMRFLGLSGSEWESLAVRTREKSLNIFQQGILNADKITTVSPTYAKEVLTSQYGYGLEADMQQRARDLSGILNGIDTDRFNPQTDPALVARYDIRTVGNREQNKKILLSKTTIRLSPHAPLFGFIGRLATPDQKGIELLFSVLDEYVKRGAGVVLLGSGDDIHEDMARAMHKKYPDNFFPVIGFDAEMAELMYAGCDFMMVPSLFEPCGLVQMIAMRYGSIPLVRKTGGLADSVQDFSCKPTACTGTGVVFRDFNQHDLWEAVSRACQLFQQPKNFRAIQQNAMKADFSWDKSAEAYLSLYRSLV